MNVFPLKFRKIADKSLIFADDAGGFFKSDNGFLDRYVTDRLDGSDVGFLNRNGHAFLEPDDLAYTSFAYRWAHRLYQPGELDYVILVPTLRCNLSCGYCQVSRVNEGTPGFDWSPGTENAVIRFLDSLPTKSLKIEFQGGEPLLALDALKRVRDFCRGRFQKAEFVVCTNLQAVTNEAWAFLADSDTFISTSLDANRETHQKQRTDSKTKNDEFFDNLQRAIDLFGREKVSALPTLDVRALPDPDSIIETFTAHGLHSIYLRPVNYQGFARKRFIAKSAAVEWNAFHSRFIDTLIEYNWNAENPAEEYYFVHCLRRVLRSGHHGHADLRNPNILGQSYIVIDYDGTFYPTDEARMITRIGQLDLSVGDVRTGIEVEKIDALNEESLNTFHPDCVHCPYQPYCGVDLVDDLSRYGRIDMPKHLTDFCQRHIYIFDKVFELLYSEDPKVRKSLALWSGAPEFDAGIAKVHK
ncbi:His-Xaa-Ser system radical SAM maturase HxsB [Agrobacterium vitis]|uniref:His-Xaa-Ser system radical SAM maturase HxsB n=1 Tax=Agrobacterium vitis TaxID=373 RepID=A0A7K1RMJ6_AGRVI|nr:His-Xaa-Ser system radical SAM maturase HxsB [Agrobacterium vitis]MVA59266.1 His-Xaa-Ser system radical SAM maturase HxsB [Agrobacterium vitis]